MILTLAALAVAVLGPQERSDVVRRLRLDPELSASAAPEVALRIGPPLVISPASQPPPALEVLGEDETPASVEADCTGHRLCDEVVWASAPPVGRRVRPGNLEGWRVLVRAGDDPLLLQRDRTFVLLLAADDQSNERFRMWPYFNYLLRALSDLAGGRDPPRFKDWPLSPVPHQGFLWLAVPLVGGLWILTLILFARARRTARRRGDLEEAFWRVGGGEPAWRSPGFARPLAGFLTLCGAMLLLLAPYLWLTNVLIPNHIQPFPEAKGAWEWSWETLSVVRFLFDAGTFVAFVKYFSEYRIKDPGEALRSAQFFVWWQILTGLMQLSLALGAAALVLPGTRYGWAAYLVLLNGAVEYPGIFGLFTFLFMAQHRYDLNIALDLLADWLLRHSVAIPIVLLLRAWGRAHPQYGEAFAAAMGIGLGYSLANILSFLVGFAIYRRLGLRLGPLFLVGFSAATAKRMLSYGFRVVLGQAVFRASKTIEGVVLSLWLVNYTFWLGIRGQIYWHLTFLFPIAYRVFETATAALSEAHGNGKRRLVQYYVVRFLQMGSLYAAIVMSFIAALGPEFVRSAMARQWHGAAALVVLAAATELLAPAAWLSDMLQKGAGRPGLFAWMIGIEQTIRIALFAALVPVYQIRGLYYAILLTIVVKCLVAWWVNHRFIIPLRGYPYVMFMGPAIAGLCNYGLLCTVVVFLPTGGVPSVALFLLGGLFSFAAVPFLAGLVGSLDRGFLQELSEAVRMASFVRPLARVLEAAARTGARLSPLGDRFRVDLRDQALAEAAELEQAARVSRR